MPTLNSPTIQNPSILIPVHPAIEDYMRGLSCRTDDPVLIEMERIAQENNFPIVGRLVVKSKICCKFSLAMTVFQPVRATIF